MFFGTTPTKQSPNLVSSWITTISYRLSDKAALISTPSDYHLFEKSVFWFGFEVPASISLVLGTTPSESRFYFADYFPSDSKFEKVGHGFDSHENVFCRLSSRPTTLKSSSKFQKSVSGSTPIPASFYIPTLSDNTFCRS
jgi:hypothetical protein